MDGFKTFILCMQVASSLVMMALSVPLILRMVGPNPWYGLRARRTMADPKVWYEANAYSGKCLLATGLVIDIASLALYFQPSIGGPTYAVVCSAITLAAVASYAILSFRFLGRIARDRDWSR